jgi:hypothetical protein
MTMTTNTDTYYELANNPMFENTHHNYTSWSTDIQSIHPTAVLSKEGDYHFYVEDGVVMGYWIGQGYTRKS